SHAGPDSRQEVSVSSSAHVVRTGSDLEERAYRSRPGSVGTAAVCIQSVPTAGKSGAGIILLQLLAEPYSGECQRSADSTPVVLAGGISCAGLDERDAPVCQRFI